MNLCLSLDRYFLYAVTVYLAWLYSRHSLPVSLTGLFFSWFSFDCVFWLCCLVMITSDSSCVCCLFSFCFFLWFSETPAWIDLPWGKRKKQQLCWSYKWGSRSIMLRLNASEEFGTNENLFLDHLWILVLLYRFEVLLTLSGSFSCRKGRLNSTLLSRWDEIDVCVCVRVFYEREECSAHGFVGFLFLLFFSLLFSITIFFVRYCFGDRDRLEFERSMVWQWQNVWLRQELCWPVAMQGGTWY